MAPEIALCSINFYINILNECSFVTFRGININPIGCHNIK